MKSKMNYTICLEPFDHSINKPYSLSSCPHTFCASCLKRLNTNKYPICAKQIASKNTNIALLELIPESEYDKLKAETLKGFIKIREIQKEVDHISQEIVDIYIAIVHAIEKVISDETAKKISILK